MNIPNARRFRLPMLLSGIAALVLSTVAFVAAGPETGPALEVLDSPDNPLRNVSNEAFGYGEKLTFNVVYKFVTAGQATMNISNAPVTVSGRPCYEITSDVRTTQSFDKVFAVRDRYQTYVDVDGIFPWMFKQIVREGKYSRDFGAMIDQQKNTARTTEGSFKVPAFVHDVLSAFYYVRTLNLKNMQKGQSFTLKNFYGKQTHDLRVRILGREKVTVDAGTFNCVMVEPLVQEGGLFKSDGRIVIYMTDDDRKIPVKVSTKVPIGSIDIRLVSYSGLRGPVAAKQ